MSASLIKGNTYRPDAQAFDEVRIFTVPRYKESELSGDEWRISATVQFLRNGIVKREFGTRNIETGLAMAPGERLKGIDAGSAYFASEGEFCDQEGCSNRATVFLKRKQEWCSRCEQSSDADEPSLSGGRSRIRQFCKTHAIRGDCGLDDADRNYEKVG